MEVAMAVCGRYFECGGWGIPVERLVLYSMWVYR